MSAEHDPEDLAAFGVLEELAHGGGREDTTPVQGEDEATEVLRRLHLEGMGLLAYELDPEAPRPGLRDEILAHLVGEETQEVDPAVVPPLRHAAAPPASAPLAPRSQAQPPVAAARPAPAAPPEAPGRAPRPRRGHGTLWLAALFALAAIGVGLWAADLFTRVEARDARIRRLENDLSVVEKLKSELAATREAMAELEKRHAFALTPSTTVFVLRPPVEGAAQPLASGVLQVAPDHQHWQLEVRGLKPEPEVQDYQLWFIVDGLPVSGGVFDAKLGKTSLLAEATMPRGTTSVAITLERKGGVQSPTSSSILLAERGVSL